MCSIYTNTNTNITRYKVIKNFVKILVFLSVFIFCLFISVPLVITNKYIQKVLIDNITTELSTKSQGEVAVEGINFSFFSGLILENVSIKDPNGNLVASMDEFHLDVRWRKLFRKKVQIEQIILTKPIIHLTTNNKGETNLQFLIDAFPKREINIEIPDILVELKSLQISEG